MKTYVLVAALFWAVGISQSPCHGQGTVVYHQGPLVLTPPLQTQLDLDQNGALDFWFSVGTLLNPPIEGIPETRTPLLDTFAFNLNDYLMSDAGRILLKPAGFIFGNATTGGEAWGHGDAPQLISLAAGANWEQFSGEPAEAFLGVRFRAAGTRHLGWIRFRVPTGDLDEQGLPPFPVIVDWAYETRPDTLIVAGVVPEPSTLWLLAAGAAALLFRKRKHS